MHEQPSSLLIMPYKLKPGALFVIFSLPVLAENVSELSNDDHRLINTTTLNFNVCAQENALEQVNNYDDVRQIAGHAIHACDGRLDEIRSTLGSKMHPERYAGLERHIKNRAIKKLLLQLMYQKSSTGDSSSTPRHETVDDGK